MTHHRLPGSLLLPSFLPPSAILPSSVSPRPRCDNGVFQMDLETLNRLVPISRQLNERPEEAEKMPAGQGKCSKIRRIVRLRQMLWRWRDKARMSSASRVPPDVPAGHVAVCVGAECRRFVVKATYLNHPVFKKLLSQAEEEYGFAKQGPLTIPCDESLFEEVIRFISRSSPSWSASLEDRRRSCHLVQAEHWPESRPLLHSLADKSIW